jgi:hypothetical protein
MGATRATFKAITLRCAGSTSYGLRRPDHLYSSSGWPSSARPMACVPGIHVGVDMLDRAARTGAYACVSSSIVRPSCGGALFTGIIATLGSAPISSGTCRHGSARPRPTSNCRMWLIYLAMPFGSALMCFRFLQVALGLLCHDRMNLPHHDHGHVDGLDEVGDDDRRQPSDPQGRQLTWTALFIFAILDRSSCVTGMPVSIALWV